MSGENASAPPARSMPRAASADSACLVSMPSFDRYKATRSDSSATSSMIRTLAFMRYPWFGVYA